MDHENLTIRIPADLKRELEKLAFREDRSVNQQVCRIIREAVENQKGQNSSTELLDIRRQKVK